MKKKYTNNSIKYFAENLKNKNMTEMISNIYKKELRKEFKRRVNFY